MTHILYWGLLALPLSAIYTALALLPLALIKPAMARWAATCGLLLVFTFSTLAPPATTPHTLLQHWPLYAISSCLMLLIGMHRHLPSLSCSIVIWLLCTWYDPLATPLPATLPVVSLETLSGQTATLDPRLLTPRLLLLWRSSDAPSTQQLARLQQCGHSLAPLTLVAVNQGDSLLAVLSAINASAPSAATGSFFGPEAGSVSDTGRSSTPKTSPDTASVADTPLVTQLRDRHQQLATALGVRHLPLLVLMNRSGRIVTASVTTLDCAGLRTLIDNHRDIFKDDDMS
ncbi:hypothetical protein [Carnimonas bestiolae]|uniref:hypothetical protein n=1 Tax=Carnimonas bestiolae TaxID=3402172 RepID=UPI003EDBB618